MAIFFKACFVILLTFTSTQAKAVELRKSEHLPAIEWLTQLEAMRDEAALKQEYPRFHKITDEIGETLSGKYGLRSTPATPEERQRMIASIVRNRNIYPGMIWSEIYRKHDRVGWHNQDPNHWHQKVANDPIYAQHIGAVLAVDAITYALYKRSQTFTEFCTDALIQAITDIAIKKSVYPNHITIKKAMATLSMSAWQVLIQETSAQVDMMAPKINAKQIFEELMVSGNEGYHGWELHSVNALASWPIEGNAEIQQQKKALLANHPEKIMVKRVWYQGVLLDSSMKGYFKGLDDKYFDGGHIGVAYLFFAPIYVGHAINDTLKLRCSPISFYLTRPVPPGRDKKLLNEQKRTSNEFATLEKFHIETARFAEMGNRLTENKEHLNKEHLDMLSLGSIIRDVPMDQARFNNIAHENNRKALIAHYRMQELGIQERS